MQNKHRSFYALLLEASVFVSRRESIVSRTSAVVKPLYEIYLYQLKEQVVVSKF